MLSVKELSEYLKMSSVNIEHVARATGLGRQTIVRLKRGDSNALSSTIEKVSNYFELIDELEND